MPSLSPEGRLFFVEFKVSGEFQKQMAVHLKINPSVWFLHLEAAFTTTPRSPWDRVSLFGTEQTELLRCIGGS